MATPELLPLVIQEEQSGAESEPYDRFFLDPTVGSGALLQQAIRMLQMASTPSLELEVVRRAFIEEDERERVSIARSVAERLLLLDGVTEVRLLAADPLRLLAITRDRDMARDLALQRAAVEAMRGQIVEEWELVSHPAESHGDTPGLRLLP